MTGENASEGSGDVLVQVRFAITEEDLGGAIAVRRAVFVEEQGYTEEQEFDKDDEGAIHIVASHLGACATTRDAERIVGTARMLVDKASDPTVATVGRVSVLPGDRGLGLGAALVLFLVREAGERGCTLVRAGVQLTALGFWQRLGFMPTGERYMDFHVPHEWTELDLSFG